MSVARSQRPGLEIPITLTVFAVIVMIVVTLSTILIWYNYQKNADAVLVVADQMMAEVSETILERVQALGQPLGVIADVAPTWRGIADKPSFLNHPSQAQMERHLESSPQIASIYLGFEDGDFFQVVSLADDRHDARVALGAPENARFATRRIFHRPDGERVEVWKFVDQARRIVGSRLERNPTLDPRVRPWYRQAIAAGTLIRTDPYAFASTREAGMTVARRFDGDVSGVLGLDLTLADLSDFLREQQFHQDGAIMLFRADGTVIAYPDSTRAFTERQDDDEVTIALATIDDLDDPLAAVLYRSYQDTDGALPDVIEVAGRDYVGRVQALPVRAGSDELLGIMLPVSTFTGPIAAIGRQSVIMSLVILVTTLPLIWLLSRRIAGPLEVLAREAEAIGKFQLENPIELTSPIREIRQLASAMARMKSGLRDFGIYVPKALVRELIESGTAPSLGGRRREVTVLFTDVTRFTDISETMPPEALMHKLSAYFEELTKVLMANGATIDKYIGDAIMALWNAPVADADHVTKACYATLLARAANDDLDRRWTSAAEAVMTTRFGLHVGEAVVGNVGSSDRMNYTAIGATVNLAARLEGLNKYYGTRILVTEAVAARVGGRFLMRTVDQVIPKGIATPIRILELRGAIDPDEAVAAVRSTDGDRAWCHRWEAAYAAYGCRDWDDAFAAFRALADDLPDDVLAPTYVERCERLRREPPGSDWTPVATFLTK